MEEKEGPSQLSRAPIFSRLTQIVVGYRTHSGAKKEKKFKEGNEGVVALFLNLIVFLGETFATVKLWSFLRDEITPFVSMPPPPFLSLLASIP